MSAQEIIAKIKSRGQEEVAKIREHYEHRAAAIRMKQQEAEKLFMDTETARIERESSELKNGILLSAGIEKRKKILTARRQQINRVFELLLNQFRELAGTEAYYAFLKQSLRRNVSPDAVIYLSAEDLEKFGEKLTRELNLKVPLKAAAIKAGVLVDNGAFNCNLTVEALLQKHRVEFEQKIGTALHVL